mmetsp:Transcript_1157/g.2749  ORF Transcript_1157/g.2749 Transcript_1157/m.2749 type:complete len:221 (+) Transcript_1157:433-1095(+)
MAFRAVRRSPVAKEPLSAVVVGCVRAMRCDAPAAIFGFRESSSRDRKRERESAIAVRTATEPRPRRCHRSGRDRPRGGPPAARSWDVLRDRPSSRPRWRRGPDRGGRRRRRRPRCSRSPRRPSHRAVSAAAPRGKRGDPGGPGASRRPWRPRRSRSRPVGTVRRGPSRPPGSRGSPRGPKRRWTRRAVRRRRSRSAPGACTPRPRRGSWGPDRRDTARRR